MPNIEAKSDLDITQFVIKRPLKTFKIPDVESSWNNSWFQQNYQQILSQFLNSSDDLRLSKLLLVSMLGEAWDRDKFFAENRDLNIDDFDRLQLITFLQGWSTTIGLLSYEEVTKIRDLGEAGIKDEAMKYFSELFRKKYEVSSLEEVSKKTKLVKKNNGLVGVFLGSFDPPTWVHLFCANFYHQYCDFLIIGVDSNQLVRNRKGEGHPRYEFNNRSAVWSSFNNIVDSVIEFPNFYSSDKGYIKEEITNFYQKLSTDIVFFNGTDPDRENRIKVIRDANALPFEFTPFAKNIPFHSTDLMRFKDVNPYFVSGLGKE